MNKVKFAKYKIFIIMALFFLVPVIFLGNSIKSHFVYQNINQNGVETVATIIQGSMSSNVTVNDVDYYSIGFTFFDELGNQHEGRTSDNYTYYEVKSFEADGTITIKYDPNTFVAIEADYKIGAATKIIMIFFFIFLAVDLLLFGGFTFQIVREIKNKGVLKNGKEYTATFVSMSSNLTVNNVRMYKISYVWENENGEIIEGVSGSDYTFYEAQAFEIAGTFKIKALDDKSVIASKPSKLLIQKPKTGEEAYCKCEYCKTVYKKEKEKCPSCGATSVIK